MDAHYNNADAPADDISLAGEVAPEQASLTDDIFALLDDGRNLVEAEIQFQKTRAAFALDRGKSGAIYGVAAFALVHLGLVALVVGAVIGLSPVIGAFAATALVVAILALCGMLLAFVAKRRFARLAAAYRDTRS